MKRKEAPALGLDSVPPPSAKRTKLEEAGHDTIDVMEPAAHKGGGDVPQRHPSPPLAPPPVIVNKVLLNPTSAVVGIVVRVKLPQVP